MIMSNTMLIIRNILADSGKHFHDKYNVMMKYINKVAKSGRHPHGKGTV
jgi:hypothetical protein